MGIRAIRKQKTQPRAITAARGPAALDLVRCPCSAAAPDTYTYAAPDTVLNVIRTPPAWMMSPSCKSTRSTRRPFTHVPLALLASTTVTLYARSFPSAVASRNLDAQVNARQAYIVDRSFAFCASAERDVSMGFSQDKYLPAVDLQQRDRSGIEMQPGNSDSLRFRWF